MPWRTPRIWVRQVSGYVQGPLQGESSEQKDEDGFVKLWYYANCAI